MNRRIIFILVYFFSPIIILILNESCTYKARVCDIVFLCDEKYNDNPVDTLLGDIHFIIKASPGSEKCYKPLNEFVPTCLATTKCAKWKNEILISSFKFYFDRPLLLNGDTIKANDDLFQVPFFKEHVVITEKENDCKFIWIDIIISQELKKQMGFVKGIYETTISCSTNDQKEFVKKRQLIFAL